MKMWNECAERFHAAAAAALGNTNNIRGRSGSNGNSANFLYESKSSYSGTVGGLLSSKIGTYRRMTMLFATIYKSMAWKIYGIASAIERVRFTQYLQRSHARPHGTFSWTVFMCVCEQGGVWTRYAPIRWQTNKKKMTTTFYGVPYPYVSQLPSTTDVNSNLSCGERGESERTVNAGWEKSCFRQLTDTWCTSFRKYVKEKTSHIAPSFSRLQLRRRMLACTTHFSSARKKREPARIHSANSSKTKIK